MSEKRKAEFHCRIESDALWNIQNGILHDIYK